MSDATTRDQLAKLIVNRDEFDGADAIIAAGWRPPARTVTTVEELDALPKGSVVRGAGRAALYEKWGDDTWAEPGYEYTFSGCGIYPPVTVIYEPEEGE